ncbi:D-alanyl-D-alanine carboxypeptidase, partial [Streptomyces sp. SID7982]|nr:D-alanyl-D-alanine carboxypeptidase [Streptomyces sp. SID7982]
TGGKGSTPAVGADQGTGGREEATHASATKGSSGVGVALAIIGGLLVVVAAAAYLVNRRWPQSGGGGRTAPAA